jgi:hypothetical protein
MLHWSDRCATQEGDDGKANCRTPGTLGCPRAHSLSYLAPNMVYGPQHRWMEGGGMLGQRLATFVGIIIDLILYPCPCG